jgi:hypothetical protein
MLSRAGRITFVAALLVVSVTAFAVGAKVRKVSSTATLTNKESGVYTGKVISGYAPCERLRGVSVYHDENGNKYFDSQDFHIGTAKTDKKGIYKVVGNQAPIGDGLIVRVAKRKIQGADVTCVLEETLGVAGSG